MKVTSFLLDRASFIEPLHDAPEALTLDPHEVGEAGSPPLDVRQVRHRDEETETEDPADACSPNLGRFVRFKPWFIAFIHHAVSHLKGVIQRHTVAAPRGVQHLVCIDDADANEVAPRPNCALRLSPWPSRVSSVRSSSSMIPVIGSMGISSTRTGSEDHTLTLTR